MLDSDDVGRYVRIQYWEKHPKIGGTYPNKGFDMVFTEVCGIIRNVTFFTVTVSVKLAFYKENEVEIPRSTIIKYGWAEVIKWYDD